jgi:hypothetical protein
MSWLVHLAMYLGAAWLTAMIGQSITYQFQLNGQSLDVEAIGRAVKEMFRYWSGRVTMWITAALFLVLAGLGSGYWLFTPPDELPTASQRPLYHIKLVFCAVPAVKRSQVQGHLLQLGFVERRMNVRVHQDRVGGMSGENVVLFYNSAKDEPARALADRLNDVAGESFTVLRGDGQGIPPGQFERTFAIHVIGEDCRVID